MKSLLIIAAVVALAVAGPTRSFVEPGQAGPEAILPPSAGAAGPEPVIFEPIAVGPAILESFEPVAIGPAIVDQVVDSSPVINIPSDGQSIVQIIINVNPSQAVVAEAAPTPVEVVEEADVVPQPIVLPTPTLPEVVVPEPVVLPNPTLPEVVVPEPVVLPSPTFPEVVVPEPIVLPSPSLPEVNPAVNLPEQLN